MDFRISDKAIQNFERAFGIFGFGILCWMIVRLGPQRIALHLHTVGWGFLWMAALKGLGFLWEALAWKLIQGPLGAGFWKLLRVTVEGESLNYITVTRVGGEPLKAVAARGRGSLAESAAGVIVLKFCVLLGFWLTVTGGFLATLLSTDVTGEIKRRIGLGVLFLAAVLGAASWLQRRGMFSPLSWILKRFSSQRQWIKENIVRLTRLDEHIVETYRSKPWRVTAAALLCSLSWAEEIFFVWLALYFLGYRETWFLPTLIATLALMLNSFFFFVPWRAGTQEGTMVLAFTLLELSEPVGLALAILRRLRELLWVFTGLTMFALESVGPGGALPSKERVPLP